MGTSTTRTRKTEPAEQWTKEELLENPSKANALLEAALTDTINESISMPEDDLVHLPGGLIVDGKLHSTAIVRELSGKDEEILAKASISFPVKQSHFVDRLLRCGVVQIGDLPESKTDYYLSEMLVGDREQLLLGIRKATYGNKLDIDGWRCINCGSPTDLSMELSDIPSPKMSDPFNDTSFEVKLRKGGFAKVKLATGEDVKAVNEINDLTIAQQQTILLSRCIISIVSEKGIEQNVAGFPSLVLDMSVPDRHAIIRELGERQPGPKYNEVKYKCDSCNEEVRVVVSIAHLFPDFGWV